MRSHVLISAAFAALALAGCGKSDKPPEGQVVATVDGTEITVHDLRAEIQQIPNAGGDAPRKLVESVALANIIDRKMLAAEAGKRNLDKTPDYLLARARAEEALLVQALQTDIQKQIKPISREIAQKYVAEHPQMFGNRKIFKLDQIQFLRPANLDELPLGDANSMAEVEKVLQDANIDYRRAPQQVDTLVANPQLTSEVIRLSGSTEPFLYVDQTPGAPVPIIAISTVSASKTEPFIGERAISFAQSLLAGEEIKKALDSQFKGWKTAYKDKIVYAKGYGPPVLPQAKAATPAPAAAPAS